MTNENRQASSCFDRFLNDHRRASASPLPQRLILILQERREEELNDPYGKSCVNDMNVGMTGDMVIRIASGTTIARGDLLMSAGDGTAKPQDDDIVRSKTIAKVTSTNVSHTYDDGTYLVPCVLMAC